jgi:predicted methyltransferase
LIDQIKEKYPQIKSFFEENRFNESIKKIPVKNLNLYKKIYDLRIRKKKKFKDIAEELIKSNYCYSDSELRAMLVRYEKLIKSLRKKE